MLTRTCAQVLGIGPQDRLTFRMFAVITALCERVTTMEYASVQVVQSYS